MTKRKAPYTENKNNEDHKVEKVSKIDESQQIKKLTEYEMLQREHKKLLQQNQQLKVYANSAQKHIAYLNEEVNKVNEYKEALEEEFLNIAHFLNDSEENLSRLICHIIHNPLSYRYIIKLANNNGDGIDNSGFFGPGDPNDIGGDHHEESRPFHTLLTLAIQYNKICFVRMLVEQENADIYLEDGRGYTPLKKAAVLGNTEITKYLLSKGAAEHDLLQEDQDECKIDDRYEFSEDYDYSKEPKSGHLNIFNIATPEIAMILKEKLSNEIAFATENTLNHNNNISTIVAEYFYIKPQDIEILGDSIDSNTDYQ